MGARPVILIGGTLCDGRLWAPIRADWRAEFVTVTVGAPFGGGGASSMQDCATDLLQDLPARSTLIGFSLGGLLALELVARAPDRFDRLALICAGAGPETPEGARARRAGEAAALADGMAAHVRDDLLPRYALCRDDGPSARTLLDMAMSLGPDAYRRQNDIAVSRVDSRPRLGRIDMPVLLVTGARDRLCPPSRHVEIAEAIPHATRHVVPDCGHMIPLEAPHLLRDLVARLHAD